MASNVISYWAATDNTDYSTSTAMWGYPTTATTANYTVTWDTSTTAGTNCYAIQWSDFGTDSSAWRIVGNTPLTEKDKFLQAIRRNLAPNVLRRRTGMEPVMDPQEVLARNSLRDMLTEDEWRRYLTNGFIMVKGKSGYWYQLFARGRGGVNVYRKGIKIASICIHTDQRVPPTDHVINLKLLVEFDEHQVWAGGNVSQLVAA
jgi:hypothetical protein